MRVQKVNAVILLRQSGIHFRLCVNRDLREAKLRAIKRYHPQAARSSRASICCSQSTLTTAVSEHNEWCISTPSKHAQARQHHRQQTHLLSIRTDARSDKTVYQIALEFLPVTVAVNSWVSAHLTYIISSESWQFNKVKVTAQYSFIYEHETTYRICIKVTGINVSWQPGFGHLLWVY